MIHQELATEKRIVLDTPNFVSFCPFASRFPFETWILPKNHNSHYENIQKNEVEELGTVLKTILLKLETALDKPAYNYIIHTSPFDTQAAAALSLAHGDHPAADARGRLRVGHGVLHQPGAAGAGGRLSAGDGGGFVGAEPPKAGAEPDPRSQALARMRIGIFGGTFDPVHLGHLILAEQCREQGRLDQVWFIPAARPPHKQGRPLTSFAQRVEMLSLAVAGNPVFRVDSLEKDRPGPSYTVDTLEEIQGRESGRRTVPSDRFGLPVRPASLA